MDPKNVSTSKAITLFILGTNHLNYVGRLGGPETGLAKVEYDWQSGMDKLLDADGKLLNAKCECMV